MFSIEFIPNNIKQLMVNKSYKENSNITFNDLRYLKITYYGFDNKDYCGELIVNKKIAKDTIEIFKILYKNKFPIEKMILIDYYNGSDPISMENNNTSAFNYRLIDKTNKCNCSISHGNLNLYL